MKPTPGPFTAKPSGAYVSAGGIFPLTLSANKRGLIMANGLPYHILGRASWYLLTRSAAEQTSYIADCVAKAFNFIEVSCLNHYTYTGNQAPYCNAGSALPFLLNMGGTSWDGTLPGNTTRAPDFTSPNEAYWSFVDTFLNACLTAGIAVALFPAYLGYQAGNQGWAQEMLANGATNMQIYGAWIANRYKNQANLMKWLLCGDCGGSPTLAADGLSTVHGAMVTGLTSVAGVNTYYSAENNDPGSGSLATDEPTITSIVTLEGAYSFANNVAAKGLAAWDYYQTTAMPAFLLEEPYDEEGPDGTNVNGAATQPVRRFIWRGMLTMIGGYVAGNGYVWPFGTAGGGWASHLNTQGAQDLARLNAFVNSFGMNWLNLKPSGTAAGRVGKTLVTGNGGLDSSTYVCAAATSAGDLLIAYSPTGVASFTVDLTAMNGTKTASWFDPTAGTYSVIGSYPNTGTQSFTTPGANAQGTYSDWVLVVQ